MKKTTFIAVLIIARLLIFLPAFAQETELIVLKNTNFVDVKKGKLCSNVDIVIEGSVIKEINQHSEDKNYTGAKLLNLEGCYIIPGLIEGHTHITAIPEKNLTIALKHGVTALRDMAGDGEYLKLLQDAVKSGELIGPDIYFSALMGGEELIKNDSRVRLSTSSNYSIGEAPWMRLVDDTSNIIKIISDAKNCGATGIKIYAYLSAALVSKLSEEAKKQNMKVWAHWEVYPATPEDVINAGIEVVSHVYFLLSPPDWNYKDGSKNLDPVYSDSFRNKSLFDIMKNNNIYLDPTIVVSREMFSSNTDRKKVDELNSAVYKIVKAAYDEGVKIIAGTDIFFPGNEIDNLPLHEEIEFLVTKTGISPIDALRAATIYNCEVLGIDNTQGTIEVGKIANLVVLTKNPLNDIHNIEEVKFVIKNGLIIN